MRPLLTALTALALLLAPAGTKRATSARAPSAPVTVSVQGDSLTVGSEPFMARELGRGFRVISDSAQVGRHVAQGLALLRGQPLGDVVVFALGTNDYADAPSWYRSKLQDALGLIGARRCLVLATIYAYQAQAPFNAVIAAVARRYAARVRVAPWARAVASGQVRLTDGVHPANSAGWRLRAKLIDDAVRSCPRAS